ncbi:hypothetical protein [Cohnella sp. CFH 77786]|nr:hypothetical protein [Cohnella sp. CFH 77786]
MGKIWGVAAMPERSLNLQSAAVWQNRGHRKRHVSAGLSWLISPA